MSYQFILFPATKCNAKLLTFLSEASMLEPLYQSKNRIPRFANKHKQAEHDLIFSRSWPLFTRANIQTTPTNDTRANDRTISNNTNESASNLSMAIWFFPLPIQLDHANEVLTQVSLMTLTAGSYKPSEKFNERVVLNFGGRLGTPSLFPSRPFGGQWIQKTRIDMSLASNTLRPTRTKLRIPS